MLRSTRAEPFFSSGAELRVQLSEFSHMRCHLLIDRRHCGVAITMRFPRWHFHVSPRMQENQRLQLIMPPRRSRVDSSCLEATFMTRPRAFEHPIFIQLASCSYRIRLKVARAAADCRHIIAIPRLAAGGLRFGFDLARSLRLGFDLAKGRFFAAC